MGLRAVFSSSLASCFSEFHAVIFILYALPFLLYFTIKNKVNCSLETSVC